MDPTTILIDNLHNALSQVNQYLALGLVSAISALVLDLPSVSKTQKAKEISVPGFVVKVPPYVAQLVLLGVYFVAGILGYFATKSTVTILSQLPAPIMSAACTQASIATSAIVYRVIAAVLPIVFVVLILLRVRTRLSAISQEDSRNTVALIGLFIIPYLALLLALFQVQCNS